jgi:Mg-chelatase subunit ChlD
LNATGFDFTVPMTNAVALEAKFAGLGTRSDQLDLSRFGDLSALDRFDDSGGQRSNGRVQSQSGVAPIDELSVGTAPSGADAGRQVNRFYSFAQAGDKSAADGEKAKIAEALNEESLARKSSTPAPADAGTWFAFEPQVGKPLAANGSGAAQKTEAGQEMAKGDSVVRKRVDIALPEVERAEAKEKLQVASGPVAAREIRAVDPSTGLPATPPADRAPEVEGRRRPVGRQSGAAANLDAVELKQLTAEHDQPAATVNKETNEPLEVARLSRDLESLTFLRDRLSTRLSEEKADASIPKTGIVEIIDRAEAEPDEKPKLLQRARQMLTGTVERSARISAQKDATDIQGLGSASPTLLSFDPYWVQTEAEKIQSKVILSQVATNLDLAETWAGKHGGGTRLQPEETVRLLKKMVTVNQDPKTSLLDIKVKSDDSKEAATIANTIAEVYRNSRAKKWQEISLRGIEALTDESKTLESQIVAIREKLERRKKELARESEPAKRPALAPNSAIPQPEVPTVDNAYSTFSLNVSDVSFKLAAASLEKGQMPDPATVRSEEFINAYDYRDPEPKGSAPIAFAWERARYPFAHNRDLVRLSVKTAASGRQPGRPLNLVLLLDNSGSMERADRLRIRQECLRVLAGQLRPEDRVSVVAFARTARLWVDGLAGAQAGELPQRVGSLTPEGGTNLEDAMKLAYQTALRHFMANGVNRVVLLTDGAANLGDVEPESLKKLAEVNRRQGVALDCFGIGWDGYNDDLLEALSRNADGRYGFINTPGAAASDFAGQLAGALKVAASDVKVQVEWNPRRVTAYRQVGYAKHQLKKEQFRDNTVDAAEIGAAEAGNALYVVQVNPAGEGPLGTMRVRFQVPGTGNYREHAWPLPYDGASKPLDQSTPALRLAASASAFSEWLASSPFAAEVTPDRLLGLLGGVPELSSADPRPKQLGWMIRQAKSLSGK